MNSNLGPQFDPHPDVVEALSSRIHESRIPKHLHGAVEHEMAHNAISNPVPLYRGGKPSKSKFLGYTEHKPTAEHFAKVSGGEVHTLPAGSVKGLRINDYPTEAPSDDIVKYPDRTGEKEWLVHKNQIK
jgi:hypothetical protein